MREGASVTTTESESADGQGADPAFGPNEWLVDELFEQYQRDKSSVDPAWWDFFADYAPTDYEAIRDVALTDPATLTDTQTGQSHAAAPVAPPETPSEAATTSPEPGQAPRTSATSTGQPQPSPAQRKTEAKVSAPAEESATAPTAKTASGPQAKPPPAPKPRPARPASQDRIQPLAEPRGLADITPLPPIPATMTMPDVAAPPETVGDAEEAPLRGAAARVVSNMET